MFGLLDRLGDILVLDTKLIAKENATKGSLKQVVVKSGLHFFCSW